MNLTRTEFHRRQLELERLVDQAGFADGTEPAHNSVAWILKNCPQSGSSSLDAIVSTVPFRIGRASENDLCLVNPTVSSRHAELFFVENDLFVKDLNSTNGTFVNGIRVRNAEGLREGDRLQFGTEKFSVLRRTAAVTPQATVSADAAGDALAYLQFDRLLTGSGITPFFQPIVRLADGQRVGFEVLARSRLLGLETPFDMFRVAVERGGAAHLSRLLRHEGLKTGRLLGQGTQFYLNTHPSELNAPALFESLEQLRQQAPEASLILEIHEAAVTSLTYLAELRARLRDLHIGFAYDDFGAGQARLLELADVPPDVIKFDLSLVQGIAEASDQRCRTVRSLVKIVRSLGVTPLAEGVETPEDANVCREFGFELAQGYWFGRPASAANWLLKS